MFFIKNQILNSPNKDVPGDERKIVETLIGTIFETQGFEVKGIESVPDGWKIRQDTNDPGDKSKPLETIIEPHGNINPPVEGIESVPEGWKIRKAKNDPVDERKIAETLL